MPADLGYLFVGQSQLGEQAMRALEMKGDLPQLLDTRFQLSINVDDWTALPYNYLRRKIRFQQSLSPAAVAGQHPQWSFTLPSVLGRPQTTIAHILKLNLHNPTAAALEFAWALTNAGAGAGMGANTNGRAVDDRAYGAGSGNLSTARLNTGSQAASILPAAGVRFSMVPANTTVIVDAGIVMTGKDYSAGAAFVCTLVVEVSQLNVAANVGFVWDERELVTSETL